MNEKTGAVFSIAEDNQPVAGCTTSKEVYASGQDYISYFSLAQDTDISAEIYGYHKLLILHEGSMEVYTDKQVWALNEGKAFLTPTEIPVGMRTDTKAIYTEISIRRNTMNNAVKAGEVDGKGVIGYEDKAHPIQAGENFKFAAGGKHWVKADGRFKMALLITFE